MESNMLRISQHTHFTTLESQVSLNYLGLSTTENTKICIEFMPVNVGVDSSSLSINLNTEFLALIFGTFMDQVPLEIV